MQPITRVAMQRTLGATGVSLGAIGQGTTKTGPWSAASAARDRERIAVLQQGIDLGMTLVDTAELYGGGHAEDLVGRAIAGRREQVVLASKFNPGHSGHADLLAAAEASLRRLRTDYLDLYQLHWPEPRVPFSETVAALAQLVAQGKVRWIGLGNMTVAQLEEARRVAGALPIVSVQLEYNLFQRACEAELLPYCAAAGWTALAYSVLDRGAALPAGPRRELLTALAVRYECTPEQLMLAWVLRRSEVVALVKTASRAHTEANAVAAGLRLDWGDLARLDAAFEQRVVQVAPAEIAVEGVYATSDEARKNAHDLVPAPLAVAAAVADGEALKPLPLALRAGAAGGARYALLDGEVSYWGWVLAHGPEAPLPAFVRDGEETTMRVAS